MNNCQKNDRRIFQQLKISSISEESTQGCGGLRSDAFVAAVKEVARALEFFEKVQENQTEPISRFRK